MEDVGYGYLLKKKKEQRKMEVSLAESNDGT